MKRLRLRLFIILVLVALTFGQRPEDDEDSVDDGLQEFMSDDADASGDGSDDETRITTPPDSVKSSSKSDVDIGPIFPKAAETVVPVYVSTFQGLPTKGFVPAVDIFPVQVPESDEDEAPEITNFEPKVHEVLRATESPPKPPPPPPKVPIAKDEPVTDEPPKTGGLSPGAIAGMIITSVIVLVVIIIVVICCKHKQQGYSRTQTQERV